MQHKGTKQITWCCHFERKQYFGKVAGRNTEFGLEQGPKLHIFKTEFPVISCALRKQVVHKLTMSLHYNKFLFLIYWNHGISGGHPQVPRLPVQRHLLENKE